MAEILSLSKARKAKTRADKETTAEVNRQRFGRTKSEKLKEATGKARAEKHIDGHKREE